jgi:dehydrogenase/reductase SDR family protein 12
VNNAGVLLNERRLTAEGLEESFATNVVGPYLLAQGLMPLLIQSPHGGRVINVSSGGMLTARLNPNDLQCSQMAKWDGSAAYAHHKRLLCYWTAEEARKQAPAVFFASTHPGWVDTPGVRSSIPDFFQTFQPYLRNLVEGVDTVLWLSGGEIDARQLPNGEFWFGKCSQLLCRTILNYN